MDIPRTIVSMQTGTQRIRDIVLSLRNFSRLDESDMKQTTVAEGLESTLLILQSRLGIQAFRPAITLVKQYGDLPGIECYPGQLNQVFLNILSNAIDAVDSASHPEEINSGDCSGLAPWDSGRIYPSIGGVKVSHIGNIYENKWWTQNNEPGTGGPWGPWKLLGPCGSGNAKAYVDLLSDEAGSFIVGTKENQVEVLFYQKQNGNFKFSLYGLDGKYIDQLTSGYAPKGPHILNMPTVGVSNVIYLIKLEQNGVYQSIQKVIIKD